MQWEVYNKSTDEVVGWIGAPNYPAARAMMTSTQYPDTDFGIRFDSEERREIRRLRAEVERVRAEEREACAAIAHRVAIVVPADAHPAGTAQQIEAEIRARGAS